MSRYIDADAYIKYCEDEWIPLNIDAVNAQPTADVVEVVRCKDCKHFYDGIYDVEYWMECDEYRIALSSDEWFCADGERKILPKD